MDEAFEYGAAAARRRSMLTDNPYPMTDERRRAWQRGYESVPLAVSYSFADLIERARQLAAQPPADPTAGNPSG